MILIDSSVWIDFLAARSTAQTDLIKAWLGQRELLTGDLILAEVLQGTSGAKEFAIAHHVLTGLQTMTISDPNIAVTAAQNYRSLRALGITIRKTIDTLIATRCIVEGIALLYSDRDFDPFVTHLGLISAMNLPR